MKKITALFLALVMTLSLCTVAMAGDTIELWVKYSENREAGDIVDELYVNGELCTGFPWTVRDSGAFVNDTENIAKCEIINENILKITDTANNYNTFEPQPNEGYKFDHWKMNGVNVGQGEIDFPKDADTEFVAVFVEDTGSDINFNLIPLIGLYWTAKYVCGLVKEASTMPYLAPIVKLAVPTAVAALCLKVVSHAAWHLR